MQAVQRAGRAGRTQPGKCFRLYTQQYFDKDMPNVTVPEIQRTSLLSACLYLKSLSNDIDVVSFDYLDPPGVRSCQPLLIRQCSLALLSDWRCQQPVASLAVVSNCQTEQLEGFAAHADQAIVLRRPMLSAS